MSSTPTQPESSAKEKIILDQTLRPTTWNEYVGQHNMKENLKILLTAAKQRSQPPEHILFYGPPGLGKTTLAHLIAKEIGAQMRVTSGPAIERVGDLAAIITNLGEGDVLFIDEIHRIPPAVEEYLYTAMEDFRIDIVLGDGVNARTINLSLKPFTLIGATTRAGMLSSPLRDRFHIREHLGFYSLEELTEIVHRSAAKMSVKIDDASANEIALRSRSTPRIANNRLRWVRDYAISKADGHITIEIARAAMKMAAIDQPGINGFKNCLI